MTGRGGTDTVINTINILYTICHIVGRSSRAEYFLPVTFEICNNANSFNPCFVSSKMYWNEKSFSGTSPNFEFNRSFYFVWVFMNIYWESKKLRISRVKYDLVTVAAGYAAAQAKIILLRRVIVDCLKLKITQNINAVQSSHDFNFFIVWFPVLQILLLSSNSQSEDWISWTVIFWTESEYIQFGTEIF